MIFLFRFDIIFKMQNFILEFFIILDQQKNNARNKIER